ncbi:MAG: AAA family ATPase [Promethearchaeota archaeon]
MTLDQILSKLNGVKRLRDDDYMALCPSHPDKNQSLHIKADKDRILMKCHSGCDTESICESLGIEMSDLFLEEKPIKPKIVATYDYQDEDENILFQVVRYEPKSFKQRHKDNNGEWVWNLDGVKRVLYHLPDLMIHFGTVYLVEGEKDADKLWEYGHVATTSPGGSSNWNDEYAQQLKNKKVVIIPDNDSAGLNYAKKAAKSLQGVAREVKCVILPKGFKDFSEWIIDRDILELQSLEQNISILFDEDKPDYKKDGDSISWTKGEYLIKANSIRKEKTGTHARITISSDYQVLAWSTFNIERSEDRTRLSNQVKKNDEDVRQMVDSFCAGLWEYYISSYAPDLLSGSDSQEPPVFHLYPYLVDGGGTILFAAPGRGKSYTALLWAQSVNCGINKFWQVEKRNVLFLNLERSKESLERRLGSVNTVLGLPINQHLLTFNARGRALADIAASVTRAVKQYNIGLIILDSVSRAGLGDLTENRPVNAIIDMLSSLCDSWLALAHTTRQSEDHVYGSIMLDAGADIIIQLKSQQIENKLGCAYEITKKNDLPDIKTQIWCLEFDEWKLVNLRKANNYEFDEIEMKQRISMPEAIKEFVLNQDTGDATATQISNELGFNRTNVSKYLSHSSDFVPTRKIKNAQYYGIASDFTG